MAVLIGHASIDENGKATGGAGGDQTGREVCTRNWYSNGWNVLLRPKSESLAEKSAASCEAACRNPHIGYDQGGRNTLYEKSKKVEFLFSAIESSCECDCSSLMHVCAIAGGANLTYGSNGFTTRTMVREFVASGDYEKLTDSKYLTSDKHLQRGDILVKEGSHTVMVLGNGTAPDTVEAPPAAVYVSLRLPLLETGSKGEAVRAMQTLLEMRGCKGKMKPALYSDFGGRTADAVKLFQKKFNLEVDGQCGPETWSALLGLTGVG